MIGHKEWQEVHDAIELGFQEFRHGLSAKMRHQAEHIRGMLDEVRDLDRHLGGVIPGFYPRGLDTQGRPRRISLDEYRDLIDRSVHNPAARDAMLGKFKVEGTISYVKAAEDWDPPACHFSLGDEWEAIQERTGLSNAGMFEAFNVPFLDKIINEGKVIHFSHDPNDFPDSALEDELHYLEKHHYTFDPTTMTAIPPGK